MTERLLREIRGIVGDRGFFLICENAGPDGEDRDAVASSQLLERPTGLPLSGPISAPQSAIENSSNS